MSTFIHRLKRVVTDVVRVVLLLVGIAVYITGLLFFQQQIAEHCYSNACKSGWFGQYNELWKLGFFAWLLLGPITYFSVRATGRAASSPSTAKPKPSASPASRVPLNAAAKAILKRIGEERRALKRMRRGPIPSCPSCGGQMVARVARQGLHAGETFWGCAAYPKCRGIVSSAM